MHEDNQLQELLNSLAILLSIEAAREIADNIILELFPELPIDEEESFQSIRLTDVTVELISFEPDEEGWNYTIQVFSADDEALSRLTESEKLRYALFITAASYSIGGNLFSNEILSLSAGSLWVTGRIKKIARKIKVVIEKADDAIEKLGKGVGKVIKYITIGGVTIAVLVGVVNTIPDVTDDGLQWSDARIITIVALHEAFEATDNFEEWLDNIKAQNEAEYTQYYAGRTWNKLGDMMDYMRQELYDLYLAFARENGFDIDNLNPDELSVNNEIERIIELTYEQQERLSRLHAEQIRAITEFRSKNTLLKIQE